MATVRPPDQPDDDDDLHSDVWYVRVCVFCLL